MPLMLATIRCDGHDPPRLAGADPPSPTSPSRIAAGRHRLRCAQQQGSAATPATLSGLRRAGPGLPGWKTRRSNCTAYSPAWSAAGRAAALREQWLRRAIGAIAGPNKTAHGRGVAADSRFPTIYESSPRPRCRHRKASESDGKDHAKLRRDGGSADITARTIPKQRVRSRCSRRYAGETLIMAFASSGGGAMTEACTRIIPYAALLVSPITGRLPRLRAPEDQVLCADPRFDRLGERATHQRSHLAACARSPNIDVHGLRCGETADCGSGAEQADGRRCRTDPPELRQVVRATNSVRARRLSASRGQRVSKGLIVATGSEVHVALEAAQRLESAGIGPMSCDACWSRCDRRTRRYRRDMLHKGCCLSSRGQR